MKKYFVIIILLTGMKLNAEVNQSPDDMNKPSPFTVSDIFSFVTPPQKGPNDKRWRFTLGGMYMKKTGNTDSINANEELALVFDDEISNFELSYRSFYAQAGGDTVENKGSGIVRFDRFIFPRVELFLFSQFEHDSVIGLDYRNSDGAGLKFVMLRNKYWKMDLSGAPVYQMERYEGGERKISKRESFRYRLNIIPVEEVLVNYTFFYIPRMFHMSTYRLSHDASLKIKIVKNLSVKVGYLYQYNNDILPGIRKRDENIYGQISIEL